MPSIALISVAGFLLLEEQLGAALLVMILTGIFRESSLHIVCFAFVWAICNTRVNIGKRALWATVYAATFAVEYLTIRKFYPAHTALNLDPHDIFFGRGLWSFTCIVTIAIVAIVPLLYLATRGIRFGSDWRHRFFLVNCALTPAWILFYRVMGGNISELRMVVPVLLPIFYGLALKPVNESSGSPCALATG